MQARIRMTFVSIPQLLFANNLKITCKKFYGQQPRQTHEIRCSRASAWRYFNSHNAIRGSPTMDHNPPFAPPVMTPCFSGPPCRGDPAFCKKSAFLRSLTVEMPPLFHSFPDVQSGPACAWRYWPLQNTKKCGTKLARRTGISIRISGGSSVGACGIHTRGYQELGAKLPHK